jgi:hypothetical protein
MLKFDPENLNPDKIEKLKSELVISKPRSFVIFEQVQLGYEDRCLIRMNALSVAMNFKENGKKTKEKYNKLKKREKVFVIVIGVILILVLLGYLTLLYNTKNKSKVFFLWSLLCIITLLIFFTF